MIDQPIAELTQTEVDLIAALSSTAPQPGDPASRGAIAQTLMDEDYDCATNSLDLADIMLKHWDVRWKAIPTESK